MPQRTLNAARQRCPSLPIRQLEKGQRRMAYLEKARAKLLELSDPRLPDEEIRERIALLLVQETGRAFWSGVQYAHQKARRQAVQR